MPGTNDIPDVKWLGAADGYKHKRGILGSIENGDISIVHDAVREGEEPTEVKITIRLVQETYDSRILEDWLPEAKGRLKGAIKDQIAKMKEDI